MLAAAAVRRGAWVLLLALAATVVGACASGESENPGTGRGDAGPRRDAGTVVPGTDSGPSGVDVDMDGVLADVDCDDGDPTVGATAERSCSSACGPGVEQCFDGTWMSCTAPTDCDCTDGEGPRTVPCERCGMQRQICVDGTWVNDGECSSGECSPGTMETGGTCGACGTERRTCQTDCTWGTFTCSGEGECTAGETDSETGSCGECGEGTRSRTRTCQSSCTWGAWGGWGSCTTSAQCSPGETQTETEACGACGSGTRSRSRSCDSGTCRWGSWSGFGACSGATGCTPGTTRACANGDSCGEEVCQSDCTWGSCQPKSTSECLYISPTSGVAGGNWRCCGSSSWQFCLSSCNWSTDCAACSGCGC